MSNYEKEIVLLSESLVQHSALRYLVNRTMFRELPFVLEHKVAADCDVFEHSLEENLTLMHRTDPQVRVNCLQSPEVILLLAIVCLRLVTIDRSNFAMNDFDFQFHFQPGRGKEHQTVA